MSLKDTEIDQLKKTHFKTLAKVRKNLGGVDLKVFEALLDKNKEKAIAYRLKKAIVGLGTDEKAVYKYLENKRKDELEKIKIEYQTLTGRTLEEDIKDDFSGGELEIANSLLEDNKYKQAAARLYNAAYGMGTDEQTIYSEFKGKDKEERDKVKEAYGEMYGKGSFEKMLKDEFSDEELTKAEQYSNDGQLEPGFALVHAMAGFGTDEALIKEVLSDKTKQEINAIKTSYTQKAKEYNKKRNDKLNSIYRRKKVHQFIPEDLKQALESELSGRDWFEVKLLLGGKPETIQEKWQFIKLKYDFEIGSGSTGFSRTVMSVTQDLGFTTSKLQLEKQYWRLQQIVDDEGKLKQGYTESDFERVYNYTETDAVNYQEAKSAVANAIGTGINITAGIVATILTAGGASAWLITTITTAVAGGLGIAVKKMMEGNAYGAEEFGVDLLIATVTTALAGVLADGTNLAKYLDDIKCFGDGFAKTVFVEVIKAASPEVISTVVEQLVNNDMWRDSILDFLTSLTEEALSALLKGAGKGLLPILPNNYIDENYPTFASKLAKAFADNSGDLSENSYKIATNDNF